jgi:hypothetical protein
MSQGTGEVVLEEKRSISKTSRHMLVQGLAFNMADKQGAWWQWQ